MKLASLRSAQRKNRHGDLVVVSRDGKRAARPDVAIAPHLLGALENWAEAEKHLRNISDSLEANRANSFPLKLEDCLAPLPTAPGFYDGSAFLSHVVRARRARGDELPPSARVTPLMYQGVSDNLLGWNTPITVGDLAFGADFEGEFAVITTDVPQATPAEKTGRYIALLTLFNDITLREVLKTEIETKFGFLQSKPNSSFAPFVVTPDEVGTKWQNGRLLLDLNVKWNDEVFGNPNGSEMHFSFDQLVAHAARTRPLSAGSIVGSGTVSNEDLSRGYACLTEKRYVEVMNTGKPATRWLTTQDKIQMDVTYDGHSLFGPIEQRVTLLSSAN